MSFLFRNEKKGKEALSVPGVKIVYGYTVRKLPIGRLLEARDLITTLPNDLLSTLFPDISMEDAINEIMRLIQIEDYSSLLAIATQVVLYMPELAVELVAHILDEKVETLSNDENLGIDGLIKLILAIVEVNKLGEALEGIKGMIPKKEKTSIGSND